MSHSMRSPTSCRSVSPHAARIDGRTSSDHSKLRSKRRAIAACVIAVARCSSATEIAFSCQRRPISRSAGRNDVSASFRSRVRAKYGPTLFGQQALMARRMVEAGVPGYVTEGWYGLHAPAGTPAAVIEKLNAAARKATGTEFFKSKLVHEGMVVHTGAPSDYDKYVRAEIARWSKLVKTNVITK